MWRMLSYPLAAFTVMETLLMVMYREAYIWLGIRPAAWGSDVIMLLAGGVTLVAGMVVGYQAAEEAVDEGKRRHEFTLKENELRFKFQTEELTRKTELEKLHIKADQDKVKRLEDLIGIPDPDGEVVSINGGKKERA